MLKDVKDAKIEKRLVRSFFTVSMITAIAAVVGLIALIVVSQRYSNALKIYGFAQGDIGKAMFEFSDTRSSLRAAIGYDEEELIAKVVQQHDESKIAFEAAFAQVENTVVSDEARTTYNSIKEELKEYWELDAMIMELGATTDRELCRQAQDIAANELSNSYHKVYDQLEGLLDVKVKQGNSLSSLLNIISIILIVVIAGTIAAAMVISMRIGRKIAVGIAEPLAELGKRLETFAEGDLASPFPEIKSGDEVEDMGDHAVHMADNLTAIIKDMGELLGGMAGGDYTVRSSNPNRYTGDFERMFKSMTGLRSQMTETLTSIGEASSQVQAGSGNLAEASQCLAEGATEQAGAVEELQATISNITETMKKSAESAEQSYLKAQQYANEADKSREAMKYMMAAMERINDSSNKIGNITAEIESIASQTNLLSLNASIEAARAGESGRGFAVVADQIRELADQSAKAAGDTRELIEGSIREVTEGNRAAERASESLLSVVDGIKQIADFSKNLKVMVEDQAEAMRQAEQGVDQISEVVQSNAATAEEASATSEELSAQSITLDELVGQFKLGS